MCWCLENSSLSIQCQLVVYSSLLNEVILQWLSQVQNSTLTNDRQAFVQSLCGTNALYINYCFCGTAHYMHVQIFFSSPTVRNKTQLGAKKWQRSHFCLNTKTFQTFTFLCSSEFLLCALTHKNQNSCSGSACFTSCNQPNDLNINFCHIDLRIGASQWLRMSNY